MSTYFEKARELGELINKSEQAKNLADARAAYQEDKESLEMMQEYTAYQKNIRESMDQGVLTNEQVQEATQRLAKMAHDLKGHAIIGGLVFAENEFNAFVNQVMNVLKCTITGESMEDTNCSSEGCSSCSGCH